MIGAARQHLDKIPDDLEFFQHQADGVRVIARAGNMILADEMGLGKLNSVSEPVLTPAGWTPIGTIRPGDEVIGRDGKPTSVLGVYPQGIQPIVRVTFQDGTWSRCSMEHLWAVQSVQNGWRNPHHWKVMTTGELAARGLRDGAGNRKWRIPMVEPVHFNPVELPVDPYLLGVILGDGSCTTGSVTLCTDREIVQQLGLRELKVNSDVHPTVYASVPAGQRLLKPLGLDHLRSETKFVPEPYLRGHPDDRLALLQGLMDTDGYAMSDGGAEFSSTSRALMDAVIELVRSLGGIARGLREAATVAVVGEDRAQGQPAWRVNIKLPSPYNPFRLARKASAYRVPTKYPPTHVIDSVEPDGEEEAVCIRVEDPEHLYVTRDYLVTHNTLQALTVAALDFQRGVAKRVLVVTLATLKGNWEEEIGAHTAFTCAVLAGSPKRRAKQLAEFDADVLIVNYEQVIAHVEELNAIGFEVLLYDEAHAIKNRSSKRTKACRKLVGDRRIPITGSPLLNNVDDLWVLLNIVDPDQFPNYWKFRNRYCNTPEAPIWMADGTFKPIGKVQVGDQVMGWATNGAGRRHLCAATVEVTNSRIAPDIIRATLVSGNYVRCTPDHIWLSAHHNQGTPWMRIQGHNPVRKGALSRVVDVLPAPTPEQQRAADWLSGVYDGEASRYFIAQSRSHNPAVWERIGRSLDVLDIPYNATDLGYSLKGGRATWVKLLNWCDITRRGWLERKVMSQLNRHKDNVVHVEHEGPGEVVALQTSTANYVAWGYASRNCVFGGFQGRQVVGVKNEAELHQKLQGVMLRRKKVDVLDLPEKQYVPIWVDLTPRQRLLYDEALKEQQLSIPGEPDPMQLENALVRMLRLKEIVGSSGTVEGHPDESSKLDVLVERVKEVIASGEPCVVFTQFRQILAFAENRLLAEQVPVWALHGDVPNKDRVPLIQEWTAHSERGDHGVMACMFQVGGVGLNMAAASKVFLVDRLYVPLLNEQAVDRLHRIGVNQTRPVQIFELLARKTIDRRITKILERKESIFGAVVEGDWKRDLVQAVLRGGDEE